MEGEKFDFIADIKENPWPELGIWGFASEKALKIYQSLPPIDIEIDIWTKDLMKSKYNVVVNKTCYLGNWQNGHKHGYGIQINADGSIYEGMFVKD